MDAQLLQKEIQRWGASLVGFAHLGDLSPSPFAPWAISIAWALNPEVLEEVKDGPTPEYYGEYERANAALDDIAEKAAQFLLSRGHRAQALPATWTTLEREREEGSTLRADFQHKTAATRAGLGFIGKSALLIAPVYGPRVRLTTVLTDLPLPAGEPFTEGRCGSCRLCVEACSAGAIKGRNWQAGMARDELVDARACYLEARRLLKERVGVDYPICGVCVAVCPWTRRGK